MAISTATALALMAGGLASGIGGGIASSQAASAQKDAAKEASFGAVRGGTKRAGNADTLALNVDPTAMERLGQFSQPLRSPAFGNPIDMSQLSRPQNFGTGFNLTRNQ